MKWGNHDIDFAEWANTAKLWKWADIVTHFRPLQLLFDDVLVDMCFGYIKLYSQREKPGISFKITNEKDCLFWNTLLLSESHRWLSTGFLSVGENGGGPSLFEWWMLFFSVCGVLEKMKAISLCLFVSFEEMSDFSDYSQFFWNIQRKSNYL